MNLHFRYTILLLAIVLLISCTREKQPDNRLTNVFCDLVREGHFVAYTDTLGSSVDTTYPFNYNNVFIFNYQLTEKKTEEFPWVNIECYLPEGVAWHELDSLKISYTSTAPMAIKLSQTNLLESGESYSFLLPVTKAEKLIVIPVSRFKLPNWARDKSIALNLSNIRSIGFVPEVDDKLQQHKGSFKVSKLVAYGISSKRVFIEQLPPIIFNSINKNKIYFTTKDTGAYEIEISDTNMRKIISMRSKCLTAGQQEVFLEKELKVGVYIINISNKMHSLRIQKNISRIPALYIDKRI